MPDGQATPQADVQNDPAYQILKPLQADKTVKNSAFKAYHDSKDQQSFIATFKGLDIPRETKNALYRAKFGQQGGRGSSPQPQPTTQPQGPPQQNPGSPGWFEQHFGQSAVDAGTQWAEQRFGQKALQQAPSWYGKAAKYVAGSTLGADLAATGAVTSTVKLGHDVVTALANDIDPTTSWESKKETSTQATDDAYGAIKGLGQMAMKVLKPETYQDPVKFGNEVAQVAMTVEGAKDLVKSANVELPSPEMRQAIFNPRAHAQAYMQLKFAGIAKQYSDARKAVGDEVSKQFNNVSQQIDAKAPGSIDAQSVMKTIQDGWQSVKTGAKMPPSLKRLYEQAQVAAASKQGLNFEQIKQARTDLFNDLEGSPARQYITEGLKKQLDQSATKYGLGDDWAHANNLYTKINSYDQALLGDVKKAGVDGAEVYKALRRNKPLTSKITRDLAQYGMNAQDVGKAINLGDSIMKDAPMMSRRLYRYAYGLGIPITLGMRIAHAPGGFLTDIAGGAAAGFAAQYAIDLTRALKLHPDLLDLMLKDERLPGRRTPGTGNFPASPQAGGQGPGGQGGSPTPSPKGLPPTTNQLPGVAASSGKVTQGLLSEATPQLPGISEVEPKTSPKPIRFETDSTGARWAVDPDGTRVSVKGQTSISEAKAALAKQREMQTQLKTRIQGDSNVHDPNTQSSSGTPPNQEPGVNKIPEGQHGSGRIAEQAKARERVKKQEETSGSPRSQHYGERRKQVAEESDLAKRAAVKGFSFNEVSDLDMEDYLKEKDPESLKIASSLKNKGKLSADAYTEALRVYSTMAAEKSLPK